jgi:hypothetical protein
MNKENEFKPGDMVQHKATGKKCVVIRIEEKDNTVIVRDSEDQIRDYSSVELIPFSDERIVKGGTL